MLLSEIVKGRCQYIAGEDKDIKTLYSYSKKAVEGGLFFCLDGKSLKGEDFFEEAEKFGAVAVVCERQLDTKITQVVVDNSRRAYAEFCATFYGEPQAGLKIIGVVGTNGKTSTTMILKDILTRGGKSVAVIGTEGTFFKEERLSTPLTTPDPDVLYKTLAQLKYEGAEYVVMEVSAHAIKLEKVSPICFEALIFTNCTEDHLDYFEDITFYAQVKSSIFEEGKAKLFVVNADDRLGRAIIDKDLTRAVSYGIFEPCDVFAVMVKEYKSKTTFVINLFDEVESVTTPLLGRFNVMNELAAATCASKLGVDCKTIFDALKKITPVSGRMEKVCAYHGGDVYIDYAHTPDGLEKSLLFLRKVTKKNLIVAFGCGGNRDAQKRPLMGKTAGDIADYVIITSDNPRFEDAQTIIAEIEAGVKEATMDYCVQKDRAEAIAKGLYLLGEGDAFLIAGKGAEEYQEIMGVKHRFSDKEQVLRLTNK